MTMKPLEIFLFSMSLIFTCSHSESLAGKNVIQLQHAQDFLSRLEITYERCSNDCVREAQKALSNRVANSFLATLSRISILGGALKLDLEDCTREYMLLSRIVKNRRDLRKLQALDEWRLSTDNFTLSFVHFEERCSLRVPALTNPPSPAQMTSERVRRLSYDDLKSNKSLSNKVMSYLIRSPYFSDTFLQVANRKIRTNANFTTPTIYTDLRSLENSTDELQKIRLRDSIQSKSPLGVRAEMLKIAAETPGFLLTDELLLLPERRFELLEALKVAGNTYPHLIERGEKLAQPILAEVSDIERVGDLIAIRIGQATEAGNRTNDFLGQTNVILDNIYRDGHELFCEGEIQEGYQKLLEALNQLKLARSKVLTSLWRNEAD